MAKPKPKPQLSLQSAHIADDAAGIPDDHWCRLFFRYIYCALDETMFADMYQDGGRAPISPVLLTAITILQYLFRVGDAQAEAMSHKAGAWAEYNEAAIIEVLADKLPEIAKVVFGPLAKTDKITIVSQDGTLGANKLSGDMANIAASMPAIIKALTGADIAQLLTKVPGLGEVKPTGVVEVTPPSADA